MIRPVAPGFSREQLCRRYDITQIQEDEWHTYTDAKTKLVLDANLGHRRDQNSNWLLNAGAGVYELGLTGWFEVSVDLFARPMKGRPLAVCANVQELPFAENTFGAIVCVGEVLAYCDPAAAIAEFARVLIAGGILICDFGSSRSFKHWFRPTFGRAAAMMIDDYNGSPERTWIYDPLYIEELISSSGLSLRRVCGAHTWSALARRVGLSPRRAVKIQKCLDWLPAGGRWCETMTLVAERVISAT